MLLLRGHGAVRGRQHNGRLQAQAIQQRGQRPRCPGGDRKLESLSPLGVQASHDDTTGLLAPELAVRACREEGGKGVGRPAAHPVEAWEVLRPQQPDAPSPAQLGALGQGAPRDGVCQRGGGTRPAGDGGALATAQLRRRLQALRQRHAHLADVVIRAVGVKVVDRDEHLRPARGVAEVVPGEAGRLPGEPGDGPAVEPPILQAVRLLFPVQGHVVLQRVQLGAAPVEDLDADGPRDLLHRCAPWRQIPAVKAQRHRAAYPLLGRGGLPARHRQADQAARHLAHDDLGELGRREGSARILDVRRLLVHVQKVRQHLRSGHALQHDPLGFFSHRLAVPLPATKVQ
mmetsp:Transcript_53956/g.167219  ORF Transcript_53956/g.167219 Transcript_53956/m.167219 type:complete len:344 (+) Transcript_53956:222-1253(+)